MPLSSRRTRWPTKPSPTLNMPTPPPPADRIPSVADLTRDIKELLEVNIGALWIKGEVSNLRRQSSGHCYFSLKDASAQISAVMFRGYAARSKVELKDGMQVLAYGGLSVYEPRGQYQLVVQELQQDGIGRLQEAFEQLKHKLEAEGLFRPEIKQTLPLRPRRVAIVTSPTGAALRDFISILRRREWTGEVLVIPARVQGQEAAAEIAAGIQQAHALGGVDLLVVGRGGGSLEDLWPFNEEVVVRAVHAATIPVISAVGHEIDFALSDFAADVRAETPSAAAELISSSYLRLLDRLERARESLADATDLRLERLANRLAALEAALEQLAPLRVIQHQALRLDDLSNRLDNALHRDISRNRERLATLAHRLARKHPEQRYELARERLRQLSKRLESVGPEQTLKRGYAMVTTRRKRPIGTRKEVKPGQLLKLRFRDGEVEVSVDAEKPLQDDLFG